MKEIELDIWFYDLPAAWQEEITGINLTDYSATDDPKDPDYEYFNNAVSYWWDCLDYAEKLAIYEIETE